MIRKHFLTYLALSTIAIAQPLLDLYGKNSTIFSTAKLSPLEVLIFILVVVFAPACGAAALDRVSRFFGPKVNEAMRLLLVGGFAFIAGLALARWLQLSGDIAPLGLAVVCSVGLPYLFDKKKWAREWSRWLSVVSIAVLATAVMQLQPILLQQQGAKTDAVVGNKDVSVLEIILDEFPLAPLLDKNGEINKARFPGFAELASVSTWYRNNVAASNFTHQAVPAMLASVHPSPQGAPFLSEYPKNIFTLFGGKTQVSAVEPVTSLCPIRVCPQKGQATTAFSVDKLQSFFRDASYVYGQRVFPPILRKRIPSVEGAWGGFGAVANKFREQYSNGAMSQPDAVIKAVNAYSVNQSQEVSVVHALLPHAPWRLTPDLRVAPLSSSISTINPDSDEVVRDTYQTFLYQVGAADKVISQVLKSLRSSKKWQNTLLVVTADHGISFIPGMPQRHTDFTEPQQVADVYRIPTFVKYPSQSTGIISDCNTSTLDLLPTIVDVLKTQTSWKFVGESLATECPIREDREVISATGELSALDGGFEEVIQRSEHYGNIVARDGPIKNVAAVGESAALIGKGISAKKVNTQVLSWKTDQKKQLMNVAGGRGTFVPSLLTGSVVIANRLDIGTEGIIVVDGVAAGVVGELSGATGPTKFTSILDYTTVSKGAHVVELFIRSGDGELTRVGQPK